MTMLFKEFLRQEYDVHMSFLKILELNTIQMNRFAEFKAAYKRKDILNFLGSQIKISTFSEYNISNFMNTKEKKGGYYLTTHEITDILHNGVIGPKTVISTKNIASLRKEVLEYVDFIKSHPMGNLEHTFLSTFFLPSLPLFIEENLEALIESVMSVLNLDEKAKLYLTTKVIVIPPNQGSRYNLHNDCNQPAEVVGDPGAWLNIHLALSNVTDQSSPLYFFPGTHKEIISPSFVLHSIMNREIASSDEEIDLFLKAFSILYTGGLTRQTYNEREFNSVDIMSPILFKYYLEKFTDNIESTFIPASIADYILFLPSLLHYSFPVNLEEEPRLTLLLRVTTDHTVYSQIAPAVAFRRIIEQTFLGSPHSARLSTDEIISVLLNTKENIESNITAAVLLNSELCETHCITVANIKNLHCKVGVLEEEYCIETINQHLEL